ncbi:aspartate kinase [Acetobacter cibinongensis]|uniref:Aspartokinase n=1 Tax=Acetobacter cibinongensis TaxID=146475 RepID=A0A1Z5YS65_9PROT|nr:aspartate kinase [Acetobacter cibinongensis]OUJ00986.1 aspartate kinase [Acetobacter cibinongensis]GAN61270.1 aspartate kinase [Acetobacter cibinongensis]GBQ17165.1 aspartate kinase [Acetobacter cibinongensis NRIC 0482]GEL57836.1 aspartokinase [Acetobacter cibinongensis]
MPGSVPRIVMKFGGTSVGDIERIKAVAARVKKQKDAGCDVLVVVSAMAGETNKLVGFCDALSDLHDPCEYDSIVSTGEMVTSGLLAIALQKLGVNSRSFAGWQVPIRTDSVHGKASLDTIDGAHLLGCMAEGTVPVVAGFQGVGPDGRVTTLGRGGSDTSAVALAAAIKADRCDIYTDVDGIYTTDPRIVSKARKLEKITYEEMLELASVGAKVLQTRSVGLAMREGVRVQVLSSFEDGPALVEGELPGSLVVDEDEIVEKKLVTGIAYSRDEAKLSVRRIPDRPGIAAAIFGPLSEANVNVDMIVQSTGADGTTNMTFTTSKTDLPRAISTLESVRGAVQYEELATDADVVKISVVGTGMRSHAGVASTMFRTLSERSINIQVISTSEIKVSVLVSAEYAELAVRALHTAYGLDEA